MKGLMQHTADNRIRVLVPTLEELFKENLGVMNDILKERNCDRVSHFDCLMRLEITAHNTTGLLVNFLSGILSLGYVQKALFCNVYFSELREGKVDARLFGKWVGQFDKRIKGIAHIGAYAKRNGDNIWESHIVFEI